MKKVFMLLVIVAVFAFTVMARADVVYDFYFDGTAGLMSEVSFVYTHPTFISIDTDIDATELDSCTSPLGYDCSMVEINPEYTYPGYPPIDADEIKMWFTNGDSPICYIFFFLDDSFSAIGEYYTIYFSGGHLSVSATPTGVPEPSTMLLLGSGLLGLWGLSRKVRK